MRGEKKVEQAYPPCFLDLFILLGLQTDEMELHILKGLEAHFPELHKTKHLAAPQRTFW
jgi:hypothetical protein